jgi:hypothetical protein
VRTASAPAESPLLDALAAPGAPWPGTPRTAAKSNTGRGGSVSSPGAVPSGPETLAAAARALSKPRSFPPRSRGDEGDEAESFRDAASVPGSSSGGGSPTLSDPRAPADALGGDPEGGEAQEPRAARVLARHVSYPNYTSASATPPPPAPGTRGLPHAVPESTSITQAEVTEPAADAAVAAAAAKEADAEGLPWNPEQPPPELLGAAVATTTASSKREDDEIDILAVRLVRPRSRCSDRGLWPSRWIATAPSKATVVPLVGTPSWHVPAHHGARQNYRAAWTLALLAQARPPVATLTAARAAAAAGRGAPEGAARPPCTRVVPRPPRDHLCRSADGGPLTQP